MLFRQTLKNTIRNLNFVKGINLLLNLSSYFNDKIFNSLGIRKSVKKKKGGGFALLDHKYVYNATYNGCASLINTFCICVNLC